MTRKTVNVANLDGDRVTSLLACGSLPRTSRAALSVLELFSVTPGHPAARLPDSLLSELQCSPISSASGPLAFQNLMMLSPDESQELADRSLLEALIGLETSRSVLEKLARYGQLLCDERLLLPAQLTGIVVYVLALAGLALHHGKVVEPVDRETALAVLWAVAGCKTIPESLRTYANRAAMDLERRQGC